MLKNLFYVFAGVLFSCSVSRAQEPIGHWTFEPGEELTDRAGNFAPLYTQGASVKNGALYLDSSYYAVAKEYTGPTFNRNKTMVIWITLHDLNARSLQAMGLYSVTNSLFDGIGFDGPEPDRWFIGSGNWARTQPIDSTFVETETGKLLQVVLVHKEVDNTTINVKMYRNGELMADYMAPAIYDYHTGSTEVYFSFRPMAFDSQSWGRCYIEEARLYDVALTREEIMGLKLIKKRRAFSPLHWGGGALVLVLLIGGIIYFKKYR